MVVRQRGSAAARAAWWWIAARDAPDIEWGGSNGILSVLSNGRWRFEVTGGLN